MPDQVIAGQENTVTMEYVNKGKGDIANVEATMEGEGFDATMKTQYVGNVASGATGTIGYAFTPHASGELKTTLKVTYEDSDGQTKTKEFPLAIPVTDMQPVDDSDMADPNMDQSADQGLPGAGVCGHRRDRRGHYRGDCAARASPAQAEGQEERY